MKFHWLVAALPLTGIACAGHAEQVRDARMERIEERADTRMENVAKNGELRESLIDKEYEARQEVADATDAPGEDATQDLIELSHEREQYAAQARTRLDKLAIRIDAANEKIGVLGSRAPLGLHNELEAAVQEYKLLKEELDRLSEARSHSWESDKSKLDQRLSGLDDRVSTLQDHIEEAAG